MEVVCQEEREYELIRRPRWVWISCCNRSGLLSPLSSNQPFINIKFLAFQGLSFPPLHPQSAVCLTCLFRKSLTVRRHVQFRDSETMFSFESKNYKDGNEQEQYNSNQHAFP
ncbi:hypothetical protein P8452_57599 [Trifolium repens]|nr:hypothetical protein P8452_57599 [Trifolium repens]